MVATSTEAGDFDISDTRLDMTDEENCSPDDAVRYTEISAALANGATDRELAYLKVLPISALADENTRQSPAVCAEIAAAAGEPGKLTQAMVQALASRLRAKLKGMLPKAPVALAVAETPTSQVFQALYSGSDSHEQAFLDVCKLQGVENAENSIDEATCWSVTGLLQDRNIISCEQYLTPGRVNQIAQGLNKKLTSMVIDHAEPVAAEVVVPVVAPVAAKASPKEQVFHVLYSGSDSHERAFLDVCGLQGVDDTEHSDDEYTCRAVSELLQNQDVISFDSYLPAIKLRKIGLALRKRLRAIEPQEMAYC